MSTKKRKRAAGYDAPRPGYRRWTVLVKIALLEKFLKIALAENKTQSHAINEAMQNWVGEDENTN